jgi:FMN reductase
MLTAMGADRLVPGCFVLDRLIQLGEEGGAIEPDARASVDRALEGFDEALAAARGRLAAAS